MRLLLAHCLLLASLQAAPPFTLTTKLVREGAGEGFSWIIPRIAPLSTDATAPELLMSLVKRANRSGDISLGLGFTTSQDGGETWAPIEELPYQGKLLRDGVTGIFGAVVPVFHPRTGRLLLLGNCVGYSDYGTAKAKLTPLRFPAYAVYDPAARHWSESFTVLDQEQDANTTSGFPWVEDDGTLLWPCSGGKVLQASFDGAKLTILARSPQIEGLGPDPKNTAEYALTKFRQRYYLAMRCADQNRVATSEDGLRYQPATPLQWDDGSVVPSAATQMRWVRQRDRLYLVYTRDDPSGHGIYRHRAPLWLAEMDPQTLRLRHETETIAVPISPGRDDLGNFGTTYVNDSLSLISTSEFGRYPKSNSRVYLSKVIATKDAK